MFAVTGITGQVGGTVARTLLAAGKPVRAVIRDETKGSDWAKRGCAVAVADIFDGSSLTGAFKGTEGVFVMVPPFFDPSAGFEEAHAIAAALKSAIEAARPAKVVYLSTIGANAREKNLLSQHTIIEQALNSLDVPITFLRPGWFMENALWDVAPARSEGVIPSFLQPLDKKFPMVATEDIGRVAAELLQETWERHRVVELEGPQRISPNQIAEAFSRVLNKPVRMRAVPRGTWEGLFASQGMKNPGPRARMLDGFNEGWIEFENGEAGSRKGKVEFDTVVKSLLERAN
jgi:uncharacterized protein YbjT (DUF2867 family)